MLKTTIQCVSYGKEVILKKKYLDYDEKTKLIFVKRIVDSGYDTALCILKPENLSYEDVIKIEKCARLNQMDVSLDLMHYGYTVVKPLLSDIISLIDIQLQIDQLNKQLDFYKDLQNN